MSNEGLEAKAGDGPTLASNTLLMIVRLYMEFPEKIMKSLKLGRLV